MGGEEEGVGMMMEGGGRREEREGREVDWEVGDG